MLVRLGKPIAATTIPGADATVFAILGKPFGAHTILTLIVRPFLTGRTNLPTVDVALEYDLELGPKGFEYVIPVSLNGDTATPLGHVESPLAVYDREFDPSILLKYASHPRRRIRRPTVGIDSWQVRRMIPYPVVE